MITPQPADRFMAKVEKRGECWNWTGSRTPNGYGIFHEGGRRHSAHRWSFAKFVSPLLSGYVIDHLCHNRCCVNPEHLQQVTQQQNLENRGGLNANSSTGVRGVYRDRRYGHYVVAVKHRYVRHHGGLFKDLAEAEAAAIALRNRLMTNNLSDRNAS